VTSSTIKVTLPNLARKKNGFIISEHPTYYTEFLIATERASVDAGKTTVYTFTSDKKKTEVQALRV
jgi:hypothetical protein